MSRLKIDLERAREEAKREFMAAREAATVATNANVRSAEIEQELEELRKLVKTGEEKEKSKKKKK